MKFDVMKANSHNPKTRRSNTNGERGAALVTMLLVRHPAARRRRRADSTTVMSANNSVGSTAEMQAYYIAESGCSRRLTSCAATLSRSSRPPIA